MSKQKKGQASSGRTFKLIHQSLIISDVNFRRQTIIVSWGDRGGRQLEGIWLDVLAWKVGFK